MTEFPADQPAEHPTGFPVESEPQGRPDPETEPGSGGEPDFDSEPDRGTTDFLAPSNNPAESPAAEGDLADADETGKGDNELTSEAAPDVPVPAEAPWGSSPETPWEPDADNPWDVDASADEAPVEAPVEVLTEVTAGEVGGTGEAGEVDEPDVVSVSDESFVGGEASDGAGEPVDLETALGEMAYGVADDVTDDADDPDDVTDDVIGEAGELPDGEASVESDVEVVGATTTSDIAEASEDVDEVEDGGDDGERGHPVVGETVERLEELRDRPVSEHAEVYADLHERLQSALAEADRTDGEHASERV